MSDRSRIIIPIAFRFLVPAFSILLLAHPLLAGITGHVPTSSIRTQPPDSLKYSLGFDWETNRALNSKSNSEYDNIRFTPVRIRYGYTNYLEFGTRMTYSSNSGDVHDNSGLESLLLTSKYRWNRNFATEVNLGSGLSDDVFPYGGDGIQFGINVPMGVSIGPGSLVGEVGYTSTDGNVSDTTSWDGYVNYGIGYAYELTRSVSLKMEFAGHGATIEQTGGTSTEDHLAFIVTPAIELDLKSNIKPSLTLGLADGSPSFALGLNYTMTFGQIQDRRVRLREGKDKSVLQQAQALKRKARKAFRKGNLKEAIQFYERALTYEPEDVELLSNLGSLHYREGNYEEARSYYRQALEVNPSDQLSRLFLGITYDQLGNTEQARKQLRKTRSVNPNSRLGKKAQAWLKRIRGE